MSDLSDPLHPWFPQQSAKVVLAGRGALAEAATAVGCLIHGDPDDFHTLNNNHTSYLRRSLCDAGWCGAREAKLIVRAGESAEALAEAAADLVWSDVSSGQPSGSGG